ncbi:MAG: oxidoreductase [Bacteroidales bacterium]|nr:oxidoreductase [Bacteroidales bacterium]
MKQKKAILIGSTGLIGGHLLDLLQKDTAFSEVKILVRRPVKNNTSGVKAAVIDFNNTDQFRSEMKGADVVFCAVGTTNNKVKGDKKQYRRVDYDIPVHAAKYSSENGCPQFVLVSSLGADSKSNNFYLQLKGEVEDTLNGLGFSSLLMFRPSLLLGKREEFRMGERIGAMIMKPLSFLFPDRMKPVKAEDVARAMIKASKSDPAGVHIYQYREIMKWIK